jgi:hypothetical protein
MSVSVVKRSIEWWWLVWYEVNRRDEIVRMKIRSEMMLDCVLLKKMIVR